MIDDKDLQYNMALYMAAMQKKYDNVKEKKKQLQQLLDNAASRIQRKFRMFSIGKKTRASIRIQRWWRKEICRLREREEKVNKFKRFYYGSIILKFIRNNVKTQNKPLLKIMPSVKIAKRITGVFPDFIVRKSALMSEHKYINKYRQYLKEKFENDWTKYEKKLAKQMEKQINRKWVKIETKGKDMYLNDQDKEVDAQKYISTRLDKIYEEFYEKLQKTDNSLKQSQSQIELALQSLEKRYIFIFLS